MTARKKILVTGSNGQLGSALQEWAPQYPDYTFVFTGRAELSVTDPAAVDAFFQKEKPDYCIHCAAYTAVDKAEDPAEQPRAEQVNALAVEYLAKACTRYRSKLVHISTDYVFPGTGTQPYKETDATGPVSVYGVTKLKGEELALKNTDALVIRTAWVYSIWGKNFVKTMVRLMQERNQLNVVSDQYGSPTYAPDLAAAILKIVASEKWLPGIFHYSNEGEISWYEFALAIKEITHADCDLKAIPTSAYPTPAKRPAWSVLDKTKIKNAYGIEIPAWTESLAICLNRLLAS